jgi:uncharacterized Fe-S cluster-containing radical SAM superfamily protein
MRKHLIFLNKASLKNKIRYNPFLRKIFTMFLINMEFPSVLGIDPTNVCNLRCTFCGAQRTKGKIGYMDFELFRKIIRESLNYGKRWMIILHNAGEPLLNKNICKMVEFIKQNKAARNVHFATNGVLLDEDLARDLINARLDQITFSIDAYTKEEYIQLKGEDSLEKVIHNAKMLMRLKRQMGTSLPLVSAKMTRRRGFQHTFSPFLKTWSGIVDEAILTPYSNWGGAVGYEGVEAIPLSRYACHFLWYYPVVNWDGKVFFCCATTEEAAVIGDLNCSTLREIWGGERLNKIRQAHLSGNLGTVPICAKCTYWAESKINLDPWLKKRFPKNSKNKQKSLDYTD